MQTKLFAHFVGFVLRPLNSFNTAFQVKATKIYTMQQSIIDLLRTFLSNFVKQEVLLATSDITNVLYSERSNQVSDDELGIGTESRLLLIEEEDAVTGTRLESESFSAVRLFYGKTVAKILAKFPFQDQVLHDLKILDPRKRTEVNTSSVVRLANRFENCTHEELDDLVSEVNDYRLMPNNQLPAANSDDDGALDQFWFLMGCISKPGDSSRKRFERLTKLCKILLVLSHSNADPERLFSMVQKVETEQRASMKSSTVRDVISVKMNSDSTCFNSRNLFTPDLLHSAKSATMQSLRSSGSQEEPHVSSDETY